VLMDGAANYYARSWLLSTNALRRKDVKTVADGKEITVSWPSWILELLQAFASVGNLHTSCVGDVMTAKSCDHGGIVLLSFYVLYCCHPMCNCCTMCLLLFLL
jgi:hypothetical protein